MSQSVGQGHMDERILNSNLFSKMIYDEATRSDSHFNHLPVFLLPNEMGGSQLEQTLLQIGAKSIGSQ